MPSTVKWGPVGAAEVAIAGASLNALPSGTASANHALGAPINNTPANLGALYGDLEINLSSAVTAGSSWSPTINVWIIPSLDGTNYATTNGGTSAGPTSANHSVGPIIVPPGMATKIMVLRGIILPPFWFRVQIQNLLNVSFPATNTSTCTLYRYHEQGT